MKNEKGATTNTVAKINNVEIFVIENGDKRVAIKPICQALGIDEEAQRQKLISDPILSSVTLTSKATGADGKQYEMVTIPFKYVFGWLFRIDSRNVKEEAKETVLRYQVQCYDALYNHFTRQSEYLKARQYSIDEQIEVVDKLRGEFKNAERAMMESRNELNRRRGITFEQWEADQSQLSIFTAKEQEG
jgi:hypothetical protein